MDNSDYLNLYLVGEPPYHGIGEFEPFSCALVSAKSIEESKEKYSAVFILANSIVSIPCIGNPELSQMKEDDYFNLPMMMCGLWLYRDQIALNFTYRYVRLVLLSEDTRRMDFDVIYACARMTYDNHIKNLIQKEEWDTHSIDNTFIQSPDDTNHIVASENYDTIEWRNLSLRMWCNSRRLIE